MREGIESWRITSAPNWCQVQCSDNSFFVGVESSREYREGNIVVEAFSRSGECLTANVSVKQVVSLGWNGTSWQLSGSFRFTDDDEWYPLQFGMTITDVSKGDVCFSGDVAGSEKIATFSLDEQQWLIVNFEEKVSDNDGWLTISLKFVFERANQSTVFCSISGKISEYISGSGTETYFISGSCSGSLVSVERIFRSSVSPDMGKTSEVLSIPFFIKAFRHN